jgi:putative FmdB family regulatory protein
MPLYEFSCRSCGQDFIELVRSISTDLNVSCPGCGSKELQKKISTFTYNASESTRLERAGSPEKPSPDYYKDPRNIGRWTEKKFKEMDVEMPSHLRTMIDASREGQFPDSMKDLKSGPTEI